MSMKFITSFKFKKVRNTVHKRTCIVRIVIHDFKKAVAPHSSTLAWKIPWMEEPGRLQSMGSLRVRHDWATSLSLFTFMHWRRKWQPTPVFLTRESWGRGAWWAAIMGSHSWNNWSDFAAAASVVAYMTSTRKLLMIYDWNKTCILLIF